MEERKAFNFYRSYYDVVNELPKNARLDFLMAILEKQFNGVEPNLKGMAKFAYLSQKHSIDKQLQGYKHGLKGGKPKGNKNPPLNPPLKGTSNQVQVQEKEQVQLLNSKSFDEFWNLYDKKKSKSKVETKWSRLKKTEVEAILKHVPLYVQSTPDKQYRKNPITYLNQRTWEDEIDDSEVSEEKPDIDTFMKFAVNVFGGMNNPTYRKIREKLITTYNGWDNNGWIGYDNKPISNWRVALQSQITFLTK